MQAEKDHMDTIITQVLKMLEKEVVDNVKNCSEYFMFLKIYATNVITHSHACLSLFLHVHEAFETLHVSYFSLNLSNQVVITFSQRMPLIL